MKCLNCERPVPIWGKADENMCSECSYNRLQAELDKHRGLTKWIETELQCSGEPSQKITRIAEALKNITLP